MPKLLTAVTAALASRRAAVLGSVGGLGTGGFTLDRTYLSALRPLSLLVSEQLIGRNSGPLGAEDASRTGMSVRSQTVLQSPHSSPVLSIPTGWTPHPMQEPREFHSVWI